MKINFRIKPFGYLLFYCPTRGMGEKPSALGEDFSLFFDAAARVQGFKDSRIQGFKERLGWSFHLTPRTLGFLDPKPSALTEGS